MFFDKCRNLVELKAEYKRLAMKHHPDMGGDVETMKAVNTEYDAAFERLKRYPMDSDEAPRAQEATAEVAEDFKKVIDALIHIEGIEIELCGSWLWIDGDTYPVREELKAAGCRWQKNKRKWYWHPPEKHVGYSKRRASMSYIRSKYGSKLIKGTDKERVALTA